MIFTDELIDSPGAVEGSEVRLSAAERKVMMGNQACAEGALRAGCRFYAGYPITPSSEIMEELARRLPDAGGAFVQMEDELGSIAAIVGASWTGVKAMTATSGPGLSLMMEGLGYAAMTETPCLIVDIQRAGPCTGQATKVGSGDILQVRFGSHGDYCPVALSPWSVQEMYDLTIQAFNLSERFRVPAVLLAEEATGHLRETVRLHDDFQLVERDRSPGRPPFGSDAADGVPPMPAFGDGANLLVTGSTHDEWGFRRVDHPRVHRQLVERINRKVLDHADEIAGFEEFFCDDAEVAVVAYGFTARAALAAVKRLRRENLPVGLLRLQTIWPAPAARLRQLGRRVRAVLAPAMNLGQLAFYLRQHLSCPVEELNQVSGTVIEPDTVAERLREMLP